MRKLFFPAVLAAMLGLASCSSDEPMTNVGDGQYATITLSAELPNGIQSRAEFADGTKAIELTYAVYEHGSTTPVVNSLLLDDAKQVKFSGRQASLQLHLVSGKSYDIVFWADAYGKAGAASSPYTFDPATQSITVDYATAAASDDNRDAFFAQVIDLKATADKSESVTLKRPFAQINVGADDYDEATAMGAGTITGSMKVANAYSTLCLIDGTVSDEVADVVFAAAAAPVDEAFPVAGYKYMEMNYVLLGDRKTADVEITLEGTAFSNTISVPAVPLERNYRTNIYGSLLTSTVDYSVTIDPAFDGKEDIEYLAPGLGVTPAGKYVISSGPGLAAASGLMVRGSEFDIVNDIDMAGIPYEPAVLPLGNGRSSSQFIINGNGHTISNLQVNHHTAALIGYVSGTEVIINDLTIKDSKFLSDGVDNGWGVSAPFVGFFDVDGALTLTNLHADNVVVGDAQFTGGICAYKSESSATIDGCSVGNSIFKCSFYSEGKYKGHVGGIIGYVAEGEISNCSASNNTFEYPEGGSMTARAGLIAGTMQEKSKIGAGNSVSGNTGVPSTQYVGNVDNRTDKTTDVESIVGPADFKAALIALGDGETLKVAAGEYDLTAVKGCFPSNKTYTIEGAGEATRFIIPKQSNNLPSIYCNGSNVTFKNLTLVAYGDNYNGTGGGANTMTYDNCTIENMIFAFGSKSFYNNCTFVQPLQDTYCIWAYSPYNEFNGCTFNTKSKAILCYHETSTGTTSTFKVSNCTFNGDNQTAKANDKAAVQVNAAAYGGRYDVTVDNCTATGFGTATPSGSMVWTNKNNDVKGTITVDGVVVYTNE